MNKLFPPRDPRRLDAQAIDLLCRAADEFGAAVVMATHSAEAAAIADVKIRMRDGRVE